MILIGAYNSCCYFIFSLNDLETETNAVKKELKEVEKVSRFTNSSIYLEDSTKTRAYCLNFLCAFWSLQELEFQQKKKERIHGDKFVEAMGSFVKVTQFSLSELDESWKDMKQKVNFYFSTYNVLVISH